MDHYQIKEEAKISLVGNRLMFLLAILLVSAITSASSAMLGLGILIAPILSAGLYVVGKQIIQNKKMVFESLFVFFKNIDHAVKLFAVGILVSLITSLGYILFIIPGVIWGLQYSQALFIMADNPQLEIMEALKKSKELMNGKKADLLLFYLSFILHFILGIITFGLYFLYFLPYFSCASINYYLHLIGNKKGDKIIVDAEYV
ncbi:MAG: DUF975 family protein [Bacilli bacterium]|jgi:uncharacterized membrane protein|nr:DUF975 family protein [Bacilli bacterium]MDY0063806.1 DUF975 family protein [Bacilli bacterium]